MTPEERKIDKIFENYRVLIMNGLGQGMSFKDIAVASEQEAKASLLQMLDLARIDQKIDTLRITQGHQQTGTTLNDKYFMHNISMLEKEKAKLNPKEKES